MTQFNPYLKWLAIREDPRKIHHYQLLGVEVFEPDSDVISTNADRQINFVRSFLGSEHSGHAQELLNHLAKARKCLLNADKKAAYDARLKRVLADHPPSANSPTAIVETPSPAPGQAVPSTSGQATFSSSPIGKPAIRAEGRASQEARRKKANSKTTLNLIGVIGGGVAAVIVAVLIINSSLFTRMQEAISGTDQRESAQLDDRAGDRVKETRSKESETENRRKNGNANSSGKSKRRDDRADHDKRPAKRTPIRQKPVDTSDSTKDSKLGNQASSGNRQSPKEPAGVVKDSSTQTNAGNLPRPQPPISGNSEGTNKKMKGAVTPSSVTENKDKKSTLVTLPEMEGEGLLPTVFNDPGIDFKQAHELFSELTLETIQISDNGERAERLRKLVDFFVFHGDFDSSAKIGLLIEQEGLEKQTGVTINAESIDRMMSNVKSKYQARAAFSGLHRLTKYYFELGQFPRAKEIADKAVRFAKQRNDEGKTLTFADEFIYLNTLCDLEARYIRELPRFNEENAWASGKEIGNYLVLVENRFKEGLGYWAHMKFGMEKEIADLAQNATSANDVRQMADLFFKLGEEKSTPKDRLFLNCAKAYYIRCNRELPREEQLKVQERIKEIDRFLKPVFRGS